MLSERQARKRLSEAVDSGNLTEFEMLLQQHPEIRVERDGSEKHLKNCSLGGELEFIKVLVKHGSSINTKAHDERPDGVIIEAAGSGHVHVVEWFLDQGAEINFQVDGKPHCNALIYAATDGHLEVVKLLIRRGANSQAEMGDMNALGFAEAYGHEDVADYLRSLA